MNRQLVGWTLIAIVGTAFFAQGVFWSPSWMTLGQRSTSHRREFAIPANSPP